MSMLIRTSRPAARNIARSVRTRGVHIENTVHNNMPFQYRNKKAFAVKLFVFSISGFSIPFLAAAYQLSKASAAS